MASLDGARVLATGSTSGLGHAMAAAPAAPAAAGRGAAARGGAVAGGSGGRGEAVAAELGAFGLAMDVRSEASVRAGVDSVWARLGGIDLLVHNAGLGMRTLN